jgi:hypothetical protein
VFSEAVRGSESTSLGEAQGRSLAVHRDLQDRLEVVLARWVVEALGVQLRVEWRVVSA